MEATYTTTAIPEPKRFEEPTATAPISFIGYTRADNAVIRDTTLSRDARFAYVMLRSFMYGDKDECFPGLTTLSKYLCCSEKTVRGYLNDLIEAGLLEKSRRGQGYTNQYALKPLTQGSDRKRTTDQERKQVTELDRKRTTGEEYEGKEDKKKNPPIPSRNREGRGEKRVKKQDYSPSPAAVIEAIQEHKRYGKNGTLKGIRAWKVAELWDFTSDDLIPQDISMRLDSKSRHEAEKIRVDLERVARRAVEGDAVTDSPDLDKSPEGSGKGELTPDELEAVRHEIVNNPKSAASHHARRFWNGEKRLNQVVIEVLDAVNHRVFGGNRNISTFGEDVEAILRDQKAYLDGLKSDSKKSSQPYRAKKTMV